MKTLRRILLASVKPLRRILLAVKFCIALRYSWHLAWVKTGGRS